MAWFKAFDSPNFLSVVSEGVFRFLQSSPVKAAEIVELQNHEELYHFLNL